MTDIESKHNATGFRFGFLVSGLAWGLLIGAFLAYFPEFSGAFEFPNENLYRYCVLCLIIAPAVGFIVGCILDSAISEMELRKNVIKNSWILFGFCVFLFVFLAPALTPAY